MGAPGSAGPAGVKARGQARAEAPTAASVGTAAGAAREEKPTFKQVHPRKQAGSRLGIGTQPSPARVCLPLAFKSLRQGACAFS